MKIKICIILFLSYLFNLSALDIKFQHKNSEILSLFFEDSEKEIGKEYTLTLITDEKIDYVNPIFIHSRELKESEPVYTTYPITKLSKTTYKIQAGKNDAVPLIIDTLKIKKPITFNPQKRSFYFDNGYLYFLEFVLGETNKDSYYILHVERG